MTGGFGAGGVSCGLGFSFEAAYGTREERAEARERQIEALKAKLSGAFASAASAWLGVGLSGGGSWS